MGKYGTDPISKTVEKKLKTSYSSGFK